jgi:hypothetical protein
MSQFMLVLFDAPGSYVNISPEEMQKMIVEYNEWAGGLAQQGKLVGGEKLKEEGGKVLRLQGKQVNVVDGPYSETKEVIGGYFIVKAGSYDEAAEMARTCPHLKYGPKIEIREVDPMK